MTVIEYFEKMLKKHNINLAQETKRNASEEILENIRFKIACCEKAIEALKERASVIRCKDCKHQIKIWHKDKRMKDGGYWVCFCDRNEDQFVAHSVNGYDDEFCSYGELKERETK